MRKVVATLALAACGHAMRPAPPIAVIAPSMPDASPIVVVATADAAVPLPAPEIDEPIEGDLAILPKICAATWATFGDGKRHLGCRSHPPFVTKEQLPDGKITSWQGDIGAVCGVEKIYRGAFTRAGAKEAVIAFSSCYEDGVGYKTNFANSLSTILVEEVNGAWRSVEYDEVWANHCTKGRRKDGRAVLFCEGGFAGPAEGELSWVYVLDYAQKTQHAGSIAHIWSSGFDCNFFGMIGSTLADGLVTVERGPGKVRDVNGDGADDYVFEATRARVAAGPRLDAALVNMCASNGTLAGIVPAPTKTTVEIVASGNSYVLAPRSQSAFKVWDGQSPPKMNGLLQTAPPAIWKP